MTDDVTTRAGFVVGIVALVVVAGTVTFALGTPSAPAVDELNASSFNSDSAVATAPEESGTLSMSENAFGETVVIDMGHGADIDREAISPMVTTLTENGATVKYHTGPRQGGESLQSALQGADAFVVFGVEQSYSDQELQSVESFSNAGGRVMLMTEPPKQQAGLSSFVPVGAGGVTSPMVPLTNQYGIAYDNGYLYNMDDNDNNYRNVYATPSGTSSLTDGVEQAVFHEAVSVNGGQTALTATEGTTLSRTRRADTYGVLTRSGNVVAVGDTSIVTQGYVYRADNEVLVGNLLDFLVSGTKRTTQPVGEQTGFGGTTTATTGTSTSPRLP